MKEKITDKSVQKKKAFIYCRTSVDSDEPKDSLKVSIETQEASSRELAEKNGYEVLDVFVDRNRSGKLYPTGFDIPDTIVENYCDEGNYSTKSRTRNGLGQLLKRINEIDIIIVRNVDRLMRPLELSKLTAHILPILQSHNILVHSHDDNIFDLHNHDQVLLFIIKTSINSRYVADRRDETIIGMKERRDNGELYFPPNFYGFSSAGHQKVKREEDQIKIIKRVFKEFLDGKSFMGISKQLNLEGVPTLHPDRVNKQRKDTNKKPGWESTTIRFMLKRTQYAGFQMKSNGVEEVQVLAYHPPVINRDTFDKVQLKLAGNPKQKNRRNTKNPHPLTELCVCGYCGYRMSPTANYQTLGGVRLKLESLRCDSDKKGKGIPECKGVQIRERGTKGLTYKSGQPYSMGLEDCLFPLVYKAYFNHLKEKARRVGLDDEIEVLKAKLERNLSHISNLNQQKMGNQINEKLFNMIINESMTAHLQDEKRLAELQKEADSIARVDIPKDLFRNYASHQIPSELKRELFHSVIDHVDVYHEHIDVYIKGDKCFTLKRLKGNNTYVLPSWRVMEVQTNSIVMQNAFDGTKRPIHKNIPITADTHLDVIYQYDNDDPMMVIFNDKENIIIMTEGIKKRPDSKT